MSNTNTATAIIPKPPYFSGLGRGAKYAEWEAKYFTTPEHKELLRKCITEANIKANMTSGGRPSGIYYDGLYNAVESINTGIAPSFPATAANNAIIARERAMMAAGGDATLGGIFKEDGITPTGVL